MLLARSLCRVPAGSECCLKAAVPPYGSVCSPAARLSRDEAAESSEVGPQLGGGARADSQSPLTGSSAAFELFPASLAGAVWVNSPVRVGGCWVPAISIGRTRVSLA